MTYILHDSSVYSLDTCKDVFLRCQNYETPLVSSLSGTYFLTLSMELDGVGDVSLDEDSYLLLGRLIGTFLLFRSVGWSTLI